MRSSVHATGNSKIKDKSERDIYHDEFCNMHFTKHVTRCVTLYCVT